MNSGIKIVSIATILLVMCSAQISKKSALIEYAVYEYNSDRLNSRDDIKVYEYFRIFENGYAEFISKEEMYSTFIDQSKVQRFLGLSSKGVGSYLKPWDRYPNSTYYSGKYSYLSVNSDDICYNAYYLDKELSNLWEEIREEIKNGDRNRLKKYKIKNNIENRIKKRHDESDLLPIRNPPAEPLSE